MDLAAYAERMRHYYLHRTDPAVDWTAEAHALDCDRNCEGAKPSMRELADAICEELRGRDVIEFAAGLGQYARSLARTARSLLATEASDERTATMHASVVFGQKVPKSSFRTMTLDANTPDAAPGRYDGALAVNWFQHLPREQTADWIDRLHRILLPKARVFLAINHLSGGNRWTLYTKPNDPNLYEWRRTYDGTPVEIIDNVYSRADVISIFAPFATQIRTICGKAYHWVVYDRP